MTIGKVSEKHVSEREFPIIIDMRDHLNMSWPSIAKTLGYNPRGVKKMERAYIKGKTKQKREDLARLQLLGGTSLAVSPKTPANPPANPPANLDVTVTTELAETKQLTEEYLKDKVFIRETKAKLRTTINALLDAINKRILVEGDTKLKDLGILCGILVDKMEVLSRPALTKGFESPTPSFEKLTEKELLIKARELKVYMPRKAFQTIQNRLKQKNPDATEMAAEIIPEEEDE